MRGAPGTIPPTIGPMRHAPFGAAPLSLAIPIRVGWMPSDANPNKITRHRSSRAGSIPIPEP